MDGTQEKKKSKSLTRLYVEMGLWRAFGAVMAAMPLLVNLIVKREVYFSEREAGIKLGFGAVITAALLLLIFIGKIKTPPTVWVIGILWGLTLLLKSILAELDVLLGLAFAGEMIWVCVFGWTSQRMKRRIEARETAKAMKEE